MTAPASQRLRDAAAALGTDRLSMGCLARLCEIGSSSWLLALLGALCVLPVPGVGTVLGTGIAAMAVAMWRGSLDAPLNDRIAGFELSRAWAQRVLRTLAAFHSIEGRLVRPRWSWLVRVFSQRRTAILVGVLAVLIALPIPFGNLFPALALVCLGVGLPSRDGAVLLLGIAMAVLGLIWPGALALGGWHLGSEWLTAMSRSAK